MGYAPPEGTAITTLPTGFEDAEAGALRLRADSALLDLGVDTEHAYDHDGAPRTPGAFDLGAYER
ncbi:MAG: hypothetical protein RLO52_01315 [Sandaracinaceae bacterium]